MIRRIVKFFLLFSLPLILCSSPFAPRSSGEVDLKLAEGENGYMARFFRGDELGDAFLNDLDRLIMGKLGSASGGLISPNRHEAHLKPGEKVYAVVKVTKDVRVERMRAILETRVTQNPSGLSTAAALHQNYFKVNYIDFSAGDGSTSFTNAVMLNRSTQDRPYVIITPAGDKLFYFAYQACGGTAGIRTCITYKFTTGPAIIGVGPKNVFTCCVDIKDWLMDVPEPTGDPDLDDAYYNSRCYEWDKRNQLRNAIICRTDPWVNVCTTPQHRINEVKVKVDGFTPEQLEAIAVGKDVRIGAPGVTETVAVAVTTETVNNVTSTYLVVQFRVLKCVTGCQPIVVGASALPSPVCSPFPVIFLKLITDAPDMSVGQKAFVGMRIVGTTEPLALTVKMDGQYLTFPNCDYQRFNVGATSFVSATTLCVRFTGGCYNIGSLVDRGIAVGLQQLDALLGHVIACSFFQKTNPPKVNLVIFNGLKGAGGGQEVPEKDELEIGAFSVANLNNTDGDDQIDKDDDEVKAAEKEKGRDEIDLMELHLEKPDPDTGGKAKLTVSGNTKIKIWKEPTKGKDREIVMTNNSVEISTSSLPATWWIEGLDKSSKLKDTVLTMEYNGWSNAVSATFVWSERTRFRNKNTDIGKSADAKYDALLYNEKSGLWDWGTNHLGLIGPSENSWTANAKEMEFTVYPPGISENSSVIFDITRQINNRAWDVHRGAVLKEVESNTFPDHEEIPNDDKGSFSEDNIPLNNHIYDVDSPGTPSSPEEGILFVYRGNFNEFVRVRFDKTPFEEKNETLEGSRCSDKIPWHSFITSSHSSRVNNAPSVSDVKFEGTGDAKLEGPTVVPGSESAVISGSWTLLYFGRNKWTVSTKGFGKTFGRPTATTGEEYLSDGIKLKIPAKTPDYERGDTFTFTTSGANINEIEENHRPLPAIP